MFSESLDVTCHKGEIFTVMENGGVASWEFGVFFFPLEAEVEVDCLDVERNGGMEAEKNGIF